MSTGTQVSNKNNETKRCLLMTKFTRISGWGSVTGLLYNDAHLGHVADTLRCSLYFKWVTGLELMLCTEKVG